MRPCAPLHRLFYALRPPRLAAEAIEEDTAWLGRNRRVGPRRLHVTLNILDDWETRPTHLLDAMVRIGGEIAAAPFRVVFDWLNGSPRSVVLRPSERIGALYAFQQRLAAELFQAGIPSRAGVRFSPHLTLVHRGRPDIDEPAMPVSWRVEEFVLIESLVGWTEHRVYGCWRLD